MIKFEFPKIGNPEHCEKQDRKTDNSSKDKAKKIKLRTVRLYLITGLT